MGMITRKGRARGQPREMLERGSGDRGGARGSWRLQASVLGALHRHVKASGRGTRNEARRSDSSRSTSFDEAAVQAGRVLPRREHDRERQRLARDRPVGRIRHGEGALLGRLSIESLAGPSGAGPKGNRRTSRARPKLEDRRQAGLHPRSRRLPGFRPSGLDLGERSWKPASNAKADEEGDSGIERFTGCSCRVVGCRSRNEASSSPGRRAPQGEPGRDEVA